MMLSRRSITMCRAWGRTIGVMDWKELGSHVVALLRACVEKRGRTTGVLNRRAGDEVEERKWENRLRISKDTQGHDPSTQKTRMDTETKRHECMYINKQQIINRERGRLRPNRPVNRCWYLLVCVRKGIGWRCCREHTGVSRSSANLPENLQRRSYGEWRRRSVRSAIRQHFVLNNARSLSLHVSLLL